MYTACRREILRMVGRALMGCLAIFAGGSVQAQFISDVNGAPVREQQYTQIDGSPYLNETLSAGSILTRKGDNVNGVLLNYDIYADEVEFERDHALFRVSGDVGGFSVSKDGRLLLFRNGFPAVDRQIPTSFYQVLYSGKVALLKRYRVAVRENRAYNSATVVKAFIPDFAYYTFKDGKMLSVGKGEKKRWLEILSDKKEQVDSMITEEKLAVKTEAGMVKLLEGYDQL